MILNSFFPIQGHNDVEYCIIHIEINFIIFVKNQLKYTWITLINPAKYKNLRVKYKSIIDVDAIKMT